MPQLYQRLIEAVSEPFRELAPSLNLFKSTPAFIDRVMPSRTLSISLTDHNCQQNCAHCNGHYLKGMQPFSKMQNVDLQQYDAVLISGGSTPDGEVPIKEHIGNILRLPEHLRLNLHTGYQQPEALLPLKAREPVVSFDLPTCDAVVKEVYGLKYSCDDFRQLYVRYCRHFKTVAHVTIGLAPDFLPTGEEETIRFLAGIEPTEVVFLVFRPTQGTRMAKIQPPALEKVIALLAEAKKSLRCPVLLGCMRPAGIYRRDLDILAWLHGYRRFVMPDHQLLKVLEEHQVKVNGWQNCCALGS